MPNEQKTKVAPLLLCLVLVGTSANTLLKNINEPTGWRFLFSLIGFLVFAGFSLLLVKQMRSKLNKD